MENAKKNNHEDAISALKESMKIIESMNTAESETGACVWVTPGGQQFCAQLTSSQCSQITGAIYVGGSCK